MIKFPWGQRKEKEEIIEPLILKHPVPSIPDLENMEITQLSELSNIMDSDIIVPTIEFYTCDDTEIDNKNGKR